MKLLLVTTWDEKCGIAVYASDLVKNLAPFLGEIEIANIRNSAVPYMNHDADIVFLPYVPTLPASPSWVALIHDMPGKKVLDYHTTVPGQEHRNDLTDRFDKVIVHHPSVADEAPNFVYIPFPILEVPGESEPPVGKIVIGTAGFPLLHKQLRDIVLAAPLIENCELLLIMPDSRHINAYEEGEVCREILGGRRPMTAVFEWLEETEVVLKLRQCSVAVFGSVPVQGGVSGCAAMGIAAKVPVVVADNPHFDNVREHCYVVSHFANHEELAATIVQAASERKDCWSALLKQAGWALVAKQHYELFREVCSVQ